jgi:L-fucono-1,5-lactonase
MKIDAHQHFWKYDPGRDVWITDAMQVLKRDFLPEQLRTELDANQVDASIAVQADQSERETLFLHGLAESNERIAGVVGWVDLASPQIAERLRLFSRLRKLRGFRHIAQGERDDRFLVWPEIMHGIAQLHAFGFTYDILIYPKQLPAAIELVSRLPEQRFVVDHLAKPDIKRGDSATWTSGIRAIARNSNVYCKLSGLVTEADWRHWKPAHFTSYLDVVFDAFGTDRLMFGSDWPVCLVAATYAQVKGLVERYVDHYAARDKQKIFGENAIRFYGLKASAHGLAA